jgi:hypothetical protein
MLQRETNSCDENEMVTVTKLPLKPQKNSRMSFWTRTKEVYTSYGTKKPYNKCITGIFVVIFIGFCSLLLDILFNNDVKQSGIITLNVSINV